MLGETTIPDNCIHGDVRLAGSSSPWQGRVEVCINNLWSSVCDNGWTSYNTQVVCAQIGYPGTGTCIYMHACTISGRHSMLWCRVEGHAEPSFPEAQAVVNSYFGDGTAPVLLNSVACSSNSTNLLNCSFSAPSSYCQSGNTAGVICEGRYISVPLLI